MLHGMRCGVTQEAACSCKAGYLPAAKFAAQRWKPEYDGMTDRSVGTAIGVDRETVQRARKAVGGKPPTEEKTSKNKRVGKDGRRYKATKPKPKLRLISKEGEAWPTEEEAHASWQSDVLKIAYRVMEDMTVETRQVFFAISRGVTPMNLEYPAIAGSCIIQGVRQTFT
jgi:hypothetical protein